MIRISRDEFGGLRRMLITMLLYAVEDYLGRRGEANASYARRHDEAETWLFGSQQTWPYFSFNQVCEVLRIEPDFVRRLLLQEMENARGGSRGLNAAQIISL